MSRSGYSDDEIDQWDHIRWRGAVKSAIRGARGQAFLREMLEVLEAMPEKRLIAGELQEADGEVCALGAVAIKRALNVALIDPEDYDQVAQAFGISQAMAREIMFENDYGGWHHDNPETRWQRMHDWVKSQIANQGGMMARDNMVAQTAASFGAEGLERGEMFQAWAFRCFCGKGMHMAKGVDVNHASRLAHVQGWRYTSKRGWKCPAHRRTK